MIARLVRSVRVGYLHNHAPRTEGREILLLNNAAGTEGSEILLLDNAASTEGGEILALTGDGGGTHVD